MRLKSQKRKEVAMNTKLIFIPLIGTALLASVSSTSVSWSPPTASSERMSMERLLTTPQEAVDVSSRRFSKPQGTRNDSLELRMENRSFDGAPPMMTHAMTYGDNKSCLECHGEGFTMGKRIARPMPHAHLENCTQCHVEQESDMFGEVTVVTNYFDGLLPPEGGTRSFDGAPPAMPHGLLMRTNCISCHGSNGYAGLQTDHPERRNCTQCHAMSTPIFLP